ncbi:MAG: response regulator [Phycisphaerae bacterium]
MSLNVLVVDDSSVARSMICKVIEMSGVPVNEIHQAGNGQEGLEVMEANWIDFVFADINMPVMNGEEMVKRIRANDAWKDTPIVVISTEGSATRIERLNELGAEFVHKPFSPETVHEMIIRITGVTQ